jgi:hypothetical protein
MPRIVADLHAHTTYSDGRYSPAELADHIASAGLDGFSVTDHDTVAGLVQSAAAASRRGLEFVPGIEMSTQMDGVEMHVLGYYIDVEHPGIVDYTTEMPRRRHNRAVGIVNRLNDLGVEINMEEVREVAGEGTIGRPHIALVLARGGHVSTMAEAFGRYIREGGPAFIPSEKVAATESIRVIHEAGGVAILAHPGHWTRHSALLRLIREGLDGIEVRHPSHNSWLVDYYRTLASDFSLLRTGGSDFHGHRDDEVRQLGRFGVSAAELTRLRAAHENRRN